MRDDFGVGFRDKMVVARAQAVFQLEVIFDNAVMNDDETARTVAVWMRVLFGGTPMCGPARVADAVGAVERLQADRLFKVTKLAFGATYLKLVIFIHHGDSRRVVAAVFEFA